MQLSILLSISFATTFLVSDLSKNEYIEKSSKYNHFVHLIYLISLKPEGGASVNSFKFQLHNHLFGLRSFYKLNIEISSNSDHFLKEISSNSDNLFYLIYLKSLKPESGASAFVNSFKFQLCNYLFALRSF